MVFSTAFQHEDGPLFSRKRLSLPDIGHQDTDLHAHAGIRCDISLFSQQNIERSSSFGRYLRC